MGDAGNDGYRKQSGIYYQVYAPNTPKVNEANAAEKLEEDFQKLKDGWEEISNIKEYNFVFNDKYGGSVQLLEATNSRLKADSPNIEFELFLAKDLENVFFELSESDILGLGFSIDRRQAIENAYQYLELIKTELERENVNFAQKILEPVRSIILDLNDDSLSFEYEVLECRCLQKTEKVDEAKQKYESLSKSFPRDPRPLLYLAEIYINDKDNDKNDELLKKSEEIDSEFWLLKLEQLVRKLNLGEKIDTKNIDEQTFPDDPKIKSSFYRLYALAFDGAGDQVSADSFIEKAIKLTPDRFSNYLDELAIIHHRMIANEDPSKKLLLSQELLEKTEAVEKKFLDYGDIGARNKSHLNVIKLDAFLVQDNIREFELVVKDTFELAINCYFDKRIELIFVGILQFVELPDNELNKLVVYLRASRNRISDDFVKVLIAQFNTRDTLFTDGKKFFGELNYPKYVEFINNLEDKNYKKILDFLKEDIPFAVTVVNTLKSQPDLRKGIIEGLPDEKNIQKEKLRLLVNFDEQDYDRAFEILKQLDLSSLNYIECRPMLYSAQQNQAWDFEVIILEKLLEKEKNEKEIFNLKFRLLHAYLNLRKFSAVMEIGEQLLDEDATKHFLDQRSREGLLNNTLIGCIERGKVDNEALKKAKDLLHKNALENPSLDFKVGVEAETYLANNEPENALNAVIEAIKSRKLLSSQEYAQLYFLFVRIGNQIDSFSTVSLGTVKDNTFVKLKGKDQWYFIGNENELDAISINQGNNKHPLFIDKMLKDKVIFDIRYSSENREYEIELIYTIEKYILWKVIQNFQGLASDGDLAGVDMIEVPPVKDTNDPKNLLKFFEDLKTRTEPLFEIYSKSNVPLAMLAISEGGLEHAIGRILQEEKGYIHFSNGSIEELEKQKELAKRIVNEKEQFYIDGTSALFLSEAGMLQKIYTGIPNLKVPQSVISMLADITGKFRYEPGQTGQSMGYAKGKLTMSSVDKDRQEEIRSNFVESIKLLESTPENVVAISPANKVDCLSEKQTPPELSDACILAQKENIPVLTEDFLYLQLNELETKKKAPEYFSSLALIRLLYEEKQISFEEYLNYFGYLSSYRFRFLNLTTEDIEKAVFGDGAIKTVKPENIRKLNFPLTLSEEYGVPFQTAFRVVGLFFIQVLVDNAITVDIAEKIFIEILETFPTEMGKKEIGQTLLGVCIRAIENIRSKSLIKIGDQMLHKKNDQLLQLTEIYSSKPKLWAPNQPNL